MHDKSIKISFCNEIQIPKVTQLILFANFDECYSKKFAKKVLEKDGFFD